MGAANRVAVNTGILYARMAITVFISLYATRLVLAALGADDFGIFNVVGGAVVMLTFLNSAMSAATQRFMSFAQGRGDEDQQKKIFNVSVALHIIIGLIIVLLLEVAGYFFFNGILKIDADRIGVAKLIYHFLVVSTFVKVISVPYDAVINAHENMLFVAILGILEAVLKLGIALFITYTSLDRLKSYGFLMAALAILLLLVQRVYCHKKYEEVEIKIRKYYDKSLFWEMTSFGGWSLLGSGVSMLAQYGQGIVLNMFFGTIVNAAQGIANQIAGQLGAFSTTMLKALNPVIVKSEGSGNREGMLKATLTGAKLSYYLLLLLALPVIMDMPFILNLWLKDVPEYAVIFCRLLLVLNLIEQMFVTLPTAISAIGKIKGLKIGVSILAISAVVLSFLFFKLGYSPEWLYYIFIVNVLIRSFVVVLYHAKKQCGLSLKYFFSDVVIKSLLITLVLTGSMLISYLSMEASLIRLLIILATNFSLFPLVVYFLGLNEKEKKLVQSFIAVAYSSGIKFIRRK
ncbi:polysaccharide biosynthesis protein [Sunxiuqinia indica]|uniref:hypothetical protein n=1 Tax=Sunxiuqinia indica TaxID=2692584 RepID=UPI001357B732|nr:hypothetical protein [Sunxiuqinia indica]